MKHFDAQMYARGAHDAAGNVRKYTGEPYWHHTEEVHAIVSRHCLTYFQRHDEMLQAAYLHDVVEDANISLSQITEYFGAEVASIVEEVTDVFTDSKLYGNRSTRKRLEAERLSTCSPEAQTIKVADMISNTKSIVQHDKGFAVTYLKEKEYLLSVLTKADRGLHTMAVKQLEGLKNVL